MYTNLQQKSQVKVYKVAVIVPVRNRPDLLEECLSSLSNLDFPVNECEILICDDGSADDLQPVIDKFNGSIPNLRLLKQQRKGPNPEFGGFLFVC